MGAHVTLMDPYGPTGASGPLWTQGESNHVLYQYLVAVDCFLLLSLLFTIPTREENVMHYVVDAGWKGWRMDIQGVNRVSTCACVFEGRRL